MTNDPMQAQDALPAEKAARREWVKPTVHDISAGRAEAAGDTRVDGSGTLS